MWRTDCIFYFAASTGAENRLFSAQHREHVGNSSATCCQTSRVPFFLHHGPSRMEYDTSLNSMLTAGLRGNEENLWASVRLLSTFFRCPCSSGICWLPIGRLLTTSSIQTHTVRGSNMRSGGPLVFWGLNNRWFDVEVYYSGEKTSVWLFCNIFNLRTCSQICIC